MKAAHIISIKTAQFRDILTSLKTSLAKQPVIAQADCFLFAPDGFVWSFNDEVAISHPLPEGIEISGAVDGQILLQFFTQLSVKEVQLQTIKKDDKDLLVVSSGKMKASFILHTPKLAVSAIPLPEKKDWQNIPKGAIEAIVIAAKAASRNETHGVLFHVSCKGNSVIGCDNFRLSITSLKMPFPSPILVPSTIAETLSQFDLKQYSVCGDWIHFINDNDVMISIRSPYIPYPDVTSLLIKKGDVVTFPEGITSALERAGVFSRMELEDKQDIALSNNGKQLLIKGHCDSGWVEETIEMPSPRPFTLHVKPDVLESILQHLKKAIITENVIQFEGKNFTYVISL